MRHRYRQGVEELMSGILKTDLRRAFSGNFVFIMLGTIGVQLLCMLDYFGYELSSVIYLFELTANIGKFTVLMPSVACLGYAGGYAADVNSGFITFEQLRTRFTPYCISKCISAYISAVCAVAAGMIGYSAILMLMGAPFVDETTVEMLGYGKDFGALIGSGHAVLFWAIKVFFRAISCGAYAMLGLMLSAFMPNVFILRVMPFIVINISKYVMVALLHMNFSLYTLEYNGYRMEGALPNFIATTATFLLLALLFAAIFCMTARRRQLNA